MHERKTHGQVHGQVLEEAPPAHGAWAHGRAHMGMHAWTHGHMDSRAWVHGGIYLDASLPPICLHCRPRRPPPPPQSVAICTTVR